MFYAQSVESTDLYKEWSFYSLIAACLQRRWYISDDIEWSLCGNHYIIFVGDPGTGKDVAMTIHKRILDQINEDYCKRTGKMFNPDSPYDHELIHRAPDTVTVEQLIYRMSLLTDGYVDHENQVKFQSAVTFCCSEFENLFKAEDTNLAGFFKTAWDCDKQFVKETRTQKNSIIQYPCINMLAGTTPEWIAKGMHYGLLNDGFLGRAIFVAGGRPGRKITFFSPSDEQKKELEIVYKHCRDLVGLEKKNYKGGMIRIKPDAKEFLDNWYQNKHKPTNPDRKLVHYYARKKALAMKQALISHFSDPTSETEVTIKDFEVALDSLERVEVNMHLALSSAGKNPIHQLAENILNFIRERNKPYSKAILTCVFHSDASEEDIGKALDYLQVAKKLLLFLDTDNNNMITFKANPLYKDES